MLAVPELLTAFWILRMPESPKFFLASGSHTKCLTVLRKMYSINTGDHPDLFPVKQLLTDAKTEGHDGGKVACEGKITRVLQSMKQQAKILFKPPLLMVTGLTSSVMFANMFG